MAKQVSKVFQHIDFAIWHVPQAGGYVYEAAGVELDDDTYQDSPFEDSYEAALEAACELYDVEIGSLGAELPVVYANRLFSVYATPDGEFLFHFASEDSEAPTLASYAGLPGPLFDTREEAIIAAFEQDLERRSERAD